MDKPKFNNTLTTEQSRWMLSQRKIVKHECQECGEEFFARSVAKFCTANCRLRHHRRIKNETDAD